MSENSIEAPRRGRPPKAGPLKQATSVRLSVDGRRLLAALAEESGLSQASVIELALRDMAKKRGVTVDKASSGATAGA